MNIKNIHDIHYDNVINVNKIVYRIKTFFLALYAIITLKTDDLTSFFSSYELFEKDKVVSENDSKLIINYYRVLNYLCALGNVEKMYIPPIIDPSKGVFDNQILFEKKMIKDLNLDLSVKNNILDIGCGRGRIAHHVVTETNARVTGINIDEGQINAARSYALSSFGEGASEDKTEFIVGNYNDPLPFSDNYFDAIYQIQALTYVKDMDKLFAEIYRVLKPKGRFSWLDWVVLDKYDPNNDEHKTIIECIKALIGGVFTDYPSVWLDSMKRSGFKVIINEIPSVDGVQYPLIEKEAQYFQFFGKVVNFLVSCKLIPSHIKLLFDRFNKYGDDFILADKMRLCTTVYHIVLEKP